jgi:pilus assembly protein CpaF
VVIEDTAEIHIRKSNLVRFEARRQQNSTPAITIRDLLKATLRHRPDRINVGHSGTLSTIHANSAYHALARFVTCVLQSTIEVPYKAIKSNIGDSINVLLHLERREGHRQVSELVEVRGYDAKADHYALTTLYPRSQQTVGSKAEEKARPFAVDGCGSA